MFFLDAAGSLHKDLLTALTHMLLNISVAVPPLPGVFSLLYTWPACPVPAEYQFGTLGHITRSSA